VTKNSDGSVSVSISPNAQCAKTDSCSITFSSAGLTGATSLQIDNNHGSITNDPNDPGAFSSGTINLSASGSITLTNLSPNPAVSYSLTTKASIINLQFNWGDFVGTFDLNCFQSSPNPACVSSVLVSCSCSFVPLGLSSHGFLSLTGYN